MVCSYFGKSDEQAIALQSRTVAMKQAWRMQQRLYSGMASVCQLDMGRAAIHTRSGLGKFTGWLDGRHIAFGIQSKVLPRPRIGTADLRIAYRKTMLLLRR